MTQSQLGVLDPDDTSGEELAGLLVGWEHAVHSMHSGVARPSYVEPGMQWLDTSGDPWLVKVFISSAIGDAIIDRIKPSTGAVDALRSSQNLGELTDKPAARANLGVSAKMIGFTVSGGNESSTIATTDDIRLTGTFIAVASTCFIDFSASIVSAGGAGVVFFSADLVNATDGFTAVASTPEMYIGFAAGQAVPCSRGLSASGLIIGKTYQYRMRFRANVAGTCTPQGMLISGVNG